MGLLASLSRWLDILAFGLFAYQQTHSAFWVAIMTMLRMLPLALFGVAYGALAARIPRRTSLLVSHGALLVTNLVLLTASILGGERGKPGAEPALQSRWIAGTPAGGVPVWDQLQWHRRGRACGIFLV